MRDPLILALAAACLAFPFAAAMEHLNIKTIAEERKRRLEEESSKFVTEAEVGAEREKDGAGTQMMGVGGAREKNAVEAGESGL